MARLPLEQWKDVTPAARMCAFICCILSRAPRGAGIWLADFAAEKRRRQSPLHYVDNLDARLEMIFAAYAKSPEIAPGIYDRARALNVGPVKGAAGEWRGKQFFRLC